MSKKVRTASEPIPARTIDTSDTSGELPGEQIARNLREDAGITPAGVNIEDVEAVEDDASDTQDDDRPAGNASTEEWYDYRLANGYTEDELEDKGRDELRDLSDR